MTTVAEPSDVASSAVFARSARLTSAFYAWERRGRGWDWWPYPVDLEPPFRPFVLHDGPVAIGADDAHKPTWLERCVARFLGRSNGPSAPPPEVEEDEPQRAAARTFVELQVSLPPETKVVPELAENFLSNLSRCAGPVAFEIVASGPAISVYFACWERDAAHLEEQLRAYFPESVVSDKAGALNALAEGSDGATVVVDFGLEHEFMRPLRTFAKFDGDPLIGIVGALSNLEPSDAVAVQLLFQGAKAPWAESIVRSVTDWEGDPFFVDAPELVKQALEKVERPLFAAVLRVAVRSYARSRAMQIARRVGASLGQVGTPSGNELFALSNDDPRDIHIDDVLARQTRRCGFLLNSAELVSLVHPPSPAVRTERLVREQRRTKAAPVVALGHELVLGDNTYGGSTRQVSLSTEHRLRHTHLIGVSGTGKSTLLHQMIVQDMEQGRGLALLDPHGDLVDQVLSCVPEHRLSDVVLIDPADADHPVPFNILSAHSELEKTLLSSDLVSVFRRLSTSWGDQMTSVLSNAVLAFLESSRGGTLADLRRFLVEADYRREFLETVNDREVVYYWQREFPLLSGKPQAPLLTRLDAFLRPKVIRALVSQQSNRVDFAVVMNERKILLVKLAQGMIGEENAALLGTLFVAKLNQLALGRQALTHQERQPFYVYLDEFQHFVTPSMATLLTGARKYRIGLVLAHQELRQLVNQDRDVAGAVLANPATRICFRVGDDDAKKLEDGFSTFTARDLQNLGVGQAVCRVDRADWDFSLTTAPPLSIDPAVGQERSQTAIAMSRSRYAVQVHSPEPAHNVQTSLVEKLSIGKRPPAESQREGISSQEPTKAVPSHADLPSSLAAKPLGRGGAQHKYLQELIKRWADANGWRAVIEQPILDGLGSVDVALERGEDRIACEVSVASTPEYELSNIQKCLAAGFRMAISIVSDRRTMAKLASTVSGALSAEDASRVHIHTPESFFDFMSTLPAETRIDGKTARGYKVRVKYRPAEDAAARSRTIAHTIATALKRLRT